MSEAISLVDRFAPWSISKSDLAAQCTLAFRFKFIDRIRTESFGEEARIGTAAHRVQELILQGRHPKEAVGTTFEEQSNLTSVEQAKVQELLGAFIAFAERAEKYKRENGVTDELYENKWAVDRSMNAIAYDSKDAFFRGIVDYGMVLDTRGIVIVDHKSGKFKPIEKHQKQLDSYAVLASANLPQIKMVKAGIHYMKTQKLDWHAPRTRDVIDKMLKSWLTRLLTERANRLSVFEPTLTPLCNWCDYKTRCPEGLAFAEEWLAKKKEKERGARKTRAEAKKAAPASTVPDEEEELGEVMPLEGIILDDM